MGKALRDRKVQVDLYEIADLRLVREAETQFSALVAANYETCLAPYATYEQAPWSDCQQFDALNARGARSLGLSEDGGPEHVPGCRRISIPIPGEEEHPFSIGHWTLERSAVGLNQVLNAYCGRDLYWVVPEARKVDPEFPYIQPDWEAAQFRAEDLLEDLRAKARKSDAYEVIDLNPLSEEGPAFDVHGPAQALQLFLWERDWREKTKPEEEPLYAYTTPSGMFMFDGPNPDGGRFVSPRLRAVVRGVRRASEEDKREVFPANYLIVEWEAPQLEWYIKAMQRVRETLRYVADRSRTERYYLRWR